MTWPEDRDAVTEWVRSSLRPEEDIEVDGIDDIRVSADLDGTDLEHLTIDASGVDLRIRPHPVDMTTHTPYDPTLPPEISRQRGTARLLRAAAAPVRVQGHPLTLDARLQDAPIDWIEYERPAASDRPESARTIEIAGVGAGMHGSVTASMRTKDLGPLLAALIGPVLATGRVHLRRLTVALVQDGADGIRMDAVVKVRWRVLTASARGTARIGVSTDGVVTVRDLAVRSAHPLVALALRVARKTIRAEIGRSHDLGAMLAAEGFAPDLHDVRVTVGTDLLVSARIG